MFTPFYNPCFSPSNLNNRTQPTLFPPPFPVPLRKCPHRTSSLSVVPYGLLLRGFFLLRRVNKFPPFSFPEFLITFTPIPSTPPLECLVPSAPPPLKPLRPRFFFFPPSKKWTFLLPVSFISRAFLFFPPVINWIHPRSIPSLTCSQLAFLSRRRE